MISISIHKGQNYNNKTRYLLVEDHAGSSRFHVGTVMVSCGIPEVAQLAVGVVDNGHAANVWSTVAEALHFASGGKCPVPVGPRQHLVVAIIRLYKVFHCDGATYFRSRRGDHCHGEHYRASCENCMHFYDQLVCWML